MPSLGLYRQISNFFFCISSFDAKTSMYAKNHGNLGHGMCHPLPGFSLDGLLSFWREDNFWECMKFLLLEFSKCIREGMLRHYFIPNFNLLSVKITPAAQFELLQLFDIVIESDIYILKDCGYLNTMWSCFIGITGYGNESIELSFPVIRKETNFASDACIRKNFVFC